MRAFVEAEVFPRLGKHFTEMQLNDFLSFPPVMADIPWSRTEVLYEKILNCPGRNFVALLLHEATVKVIEEEGLSALEIFRWAEILSNAEHIESRPTIPPDEVLLLAKERKVKIIYIYIY